MLGEFWQGLKLKNIISKPEFNYIREESAEEREIRRLAH